MQALRKSLSSLLAEIRGNRNLQYGVLAIVLLVCVELAMGWVDGLAAKGKQLQELRSELRTLRNQSRDEAALRRQLIELENTQKIVDGRLWIVSSDPVGQARLKDWLTEILKKAGAKNFNLVLSSPRALGVREGSSDTGSTTSGVNKPEAMQPTSGDISTKERTKNMREVRANLTFVFTPASLEQVLSDIEGGEPLAMVESLNVGRRDRKVEMTVRVLMRIGQQDEPVVEKANDQGINPEPKTPEQKAPAVEPEKTGASAVLPQSGNGAAGVKR